MTELERFWAKVDKTADCWLWTASLSDGYGKFNNGKNWRAHRYMWLIILRREIPEGLVLNHLCRNRHCVNPQHLETTTQEGNVRYSSQLVTHCPAGHEYSEANTYFATSGGRQPFRMCRACHRERERARKARLKSASTMRGAAR